MAELITRKENAVGWVIFSNPGKFNAVSHDMWMALPKAIAAFDADPEVRMIVITGDGDKAGRPRSRATRPGRCGNRSTRTRSSRPPGRAR